MGNVTIEEFMRFILQPENDDRLFEYIDEKIVEVDINFYSSVVGAQMVGYILPYVQSNRLGFLTGAKGGYEVGNDRYLPSIGFVSKKRQAEPSHEIFNPNPPDLAVEVLAPTTEPKKVRTKIANYLAVGTTVWVVARRKKGSRYMVLVNQSKCCAWMILNGGDVLPGFTLAVKDIFES